MRFADVAVAYMDRQIGDQDTRVLVRKRERGRWGRDGTEGVRRIDRRCRISALGLSCDSERTACEDGTK